MFQKDSSDIIYTNILSDVGPYSEGKTEHVTQAPEEEDISSFYTARVIFIA